MSNQYIRYPSPGSGGGGNAAASPTGSAPPADADYIGFNNSGTLVGVSPSTPLPVVVTGAVTGPVTVVQPTASLLNADINNISGTVSLPTGASTAANQATEITALGTINTTLGSPFQAGGSIGNTSFIATQSSGSNLHVDVDNFPATQPVSGTVAVSNFPATQPVSAVSLPLPTGASTSANQTTEITALGTINTTLGSPFQAGGSIGNTTFAVTQSTSPWVVSGTVATTNAANTNGSASNSTSISNTSATSFSPPTHAVGFVIEAESTNTVNLRYAAGTTATNSVGMLLEPGRDSGYIPTAVTVTIIAATTATGQSAGIQWVLSS